MNIQCHYNKIYQSIKKNQCSLVSSRFKVKILHHLPAVAEVLLLLLAVGAGGLATVSSLALRSVNLVTTSPIVGRFSGFTSSISLIMLLIAFSRGVSDDLSMFGWNFRNSLFLVSHSTFPRL